MSKFDCPYLIEPARWCLRFHSRSSVSDLTGADGPSVASQWLKSRFIPYLRTIEQFASDPLEFPEPEQMLHWSMFCRKSGSIVLGILAGSITIAPSRLRTSMASDIV